MISTPLADKVYKGLFIFCKTGNLRSDDGRTLHISNIQDWKYYEEKALAYIRLKLTGQPELFKLSKKDGENISRMKRIPFGYPQFVFYEKQEWMLIFLENALGIGNQYGISVNFNGENPIDICDLSESEEIEEE